jgi:hypothetical protein
MSVRPCADMFMHTQRVWHWSVSYNGWWPSSGLTDSPQRGVSEVATIKHCITPGRTHVHTRWYPCTSVSVPYFR